jgi:hypothetical protein
VFQNCGAQWGRGRRQRSCMHTPVDLEIAYRNAESIEEGFRKEVSMTRQDSEQEEEEDKDHHILLCQMQLFKRPIKNINFGNIRKRQDKNRHIVDHSQEMQAPSFVPRRGPASSGSRAQSRARVRRGSMGPGKTAHARASSSPDPVRGHPRRMTSRCRECSRPH